MLKKSRVLLFLCIFSSSLNASLVTTDHRIGWRKDGQKRRVVITEINKQNYLSVTQLAAVADASLDWQTVSKRVCLSRTGKTLCFDWEKQGQAMKHGGQIYLPVRYVFEEEFEEFSGTSITWDEKGNQFIQNTPVTVSLPPVENTGESYRLRLDVADGVKYELLEQNDRRIWLRFTGGRAAGSAVLEGDNVIQQVRLVQRRRSTDVLVALGGAAVSNEIYFDEQNKKLVIDVIRKGEDAPAGPVVAAAPVPRVDVAVKKETPKPATGSGVRTIVIDAGHGGHDAGAIGVRGTYEKDINLKVAKLLAERLAKEKNIRVILTRDSDEFVPLATRTQMANAARADLFISIHCNSSLSSKHSGMELYVLSPEATDEAAEAVARVENSVIALESKKGANTDKLSTLLASMAVNNYINESLESATLLGRAAKTHASVPNSVIKEANFYVLRGAQMPSVLIELEYVSNPIAELKLRSSRYHSQMARALTAGVLDIDRRARKQQEARGARGRNTAREQ